jgi:Terminase RNaseH-like domain
LPILPVEPQGDKLSRAHAVSPLVESGRVCVPESAAWLNDFIEEMISFPGAPHDDQVDALTQALAYMRSSGGDSESFQEMGRQMAAYDAQRRRGAPALRSMTMNSRDLEDAEDAPSVDGIRYTNVSRLARFRRGAW